MDQVWPLLHGLETESQARHGCSGDSPGRKTKGGWDVVEVSLGVPGKPKWEKARDDQHRRNTNS